MKKLALIALASASLFGLEAQAQTVDFSKSTLKFTGKQLGTAFTGQFKKFSADINFDPAQLGKAQAQIQIEMASSALPSKEAESELKGKNWFDVAGFPQAKFIATEFKSAGENNYIAVGKLTLKGITKNVSLPFSAKKQADNAWVFDGKIRINRLDFKLGQGVWADIETVANEVDVQFRLIAK